MDKNTGCQTLECPFVCNDLNPSVHEAPVKSSPLSLALLDADCHRRLLLQITLANLFLLITPY